MMRSSVIVPSPFAAQYSMSNALSYRYTAMASLLGTKMQTIYFISATSLLILGYVIFRIIVRRAYADQVRLGAIPSTLQLLVFVSFFTFPYLYNPPEWALFWLARDESTQGWYLVGLLVICVGFIIAFGTMAWFGLGRAFGLRTERLMKSGPYRISRNPQILGGFLLVIGISLQAPSLYMVGWILIYVVITHWMVTTEEEHLQRIFGREYEEYCSEVPRYLFI
jgi:protein-S-isoprenylcysteine O-methyltransferase Ste14